MKVFRSVAAPKLPPGPRIVAVGSFDGLHLGHQAVLARAKELAARHRAVSAALTFDPPPGIFFNCAQQEGASVAPSKKAHPPSRWADFLLDGHSGKLRLLTTVEQKLRLMEQIGLDEAVFLTFDASLAALSPPEFARQILKDGLDASIVVCGPDHRFGAGGAGDCLSLVSSGLSLSAEILPPVNYEGQAVSSTRIRGFVDSGRLESAASCLGRPYSVVGVRVPGEGRGALLGFPTINLRWDPLQQLPPSGVYACQVALLAPEGFGSGPRQAKDEPQPALLWAAVSLGSKPTFPGSPLALEIHLLSQAPAPEPDETYEVYFVRRLREQIRFQSEEPLKAQMAKDCEAVRKLAEAK